MKTSFKTAYAKRERYVTELSTDGGAKQAFKDECDINNILQRYQKTGVLEHVARRKPQWGDVPAVDFQRAMEIVAEGNSMFEELPGSIRARFNNDPAEFLQFMQDEDNLAEARELGLIPEATGDERQIGSAHGGDVPAGTPAGNQPPTTTGEAKGGETKTPPDPQPGN